MQTFSGLTSLELMMHVKINPLDGCHGVYTWRPELFLYQTVNMFIFAVKLDILKWRSMETDSLLEPDPGGQ